ncbi:MAG: tRNA 2-thiouridine(34) synthase MnmA, partial [Candidatus Magasanikbacteria bacterium]|nr:tRNA 2-thiouridine(34) synthase MnmA [Candidatus Magasanikbacteria bacterium]
MKRNKKKVFVGMSGGVDSSVAAALLIKRGFDVVGVHLKCYNVDGCAEQDAEDARRAAETLDIPFYVFDMEQEYKDKVVEYMVDGYKKGITPNPDVMCNKEIKFGLFLKKALELGAEYVATGHYVRLKKVGKSYKLFVAKDKNKDQSYFLWTLTQDQLKHALFPVGDFVKPEIRKLAKKLKLPNAEKKDSQGICFLGQVSLKDFLGNYIPEKKGIVVNTSGKVIGEHKGAYFYTIGQRSGLGIGGNAKPLYVAEKDIKENALLVAEEGDPVLSKKEVSLGGMNFINKHHSTIRANGRMPVMVRVRYRQPLFKATLVQISWPGRQKSKVPGRAGESLKFNSEDIKYAIRLASANATAGIEKIGATEGLLAK